jgi:hypothetical protein
LNGSRRDINDSCHERGLVVGVGGPEFPVLWLWLFIPVRAQIGKQTEKSPEIDKNAAFSNDNVRHPPIPVTIIAYEIRFSERGV